MGGISTGVGIFSGLDTQSLIQQLLAVESRPKILMQQRIVDLQLQQSAYLDLNSRLDALKSAASSFRINKIFSSKNAVSSDENVLTASASVGAVPGSYDFIVDRLVTTRQLLSRGFADTDSSAVGASSFTFESDKARLDRDMELAALNGGNGISRGVVEVSIDGGTAVDIDLSRAVTVNDVLDAFNNAGIDVVASVEDGHFVLTTSGSTISVSDKTGSTTAQDLGIAKSSGTNTLTGDDVYILADSSLLSLLNDGNGVSFQNELADLNVSLADGSNLTIDFQAAGNAERTPGECRYTEDVIRAYLGEAVV